MTESIMVAALMKEFPRKRKGLLGFLNRDSFLAVRGISFSVGRGEIFGLLGPNGAGKTTTIKMLCTLLAPTSGRALVNGFDIDQEASQVRQNLGTVLTGERSIYWKLTGKENLVYFGCLYGLTRREASIRADNLLERLELAERSNELVEKYSTGMKQRIALGKALMADPLILLLDEPTVGLDPQSAFKVRELIQELQAAGKTILITTHYMEEADRLCNRVAIIDNGTIIALDTPSNLKAGLSDKRMVSLVIDN